MTRILFFPDRKGGSRKPNSKITEMKNSPSTLRWVPAAVTSLLFFSANPVWAAAIAWVNTSGGDWNVAGNWNPAQVPGAADTATINAAGTYVVTVSDTESVASFTIGGGVGAQTLQINSGGVLNEAGGTLAQTGSLLVAAGGSLNMASTFSLFGPLTNAGTMNLTNASISLYNNNGAPYLGGIDNQGQMNFYGASGDHISSQEGHEYLTNQGTINEQPGAGVSSINVYAGALAGTYNAAPGTTLQFVGGSAANPLTPGTPPVLNGPGQFEFTSGYLLLTVETIPNLALIGGTLELGPGFQGGSITNLTLDGITLGVGTYSVSGTLIATNSTLSGAVTVNSGGALNESSANLANTGSLTVAAGGTLNVAAGFSLFGPVTNAGTMNLTNANVALYNNNGIPYLGGIDNQGQMNFYGASGDHIFSQDGYEYLTNQGTINQQSGAGTCSISVFSGAMAGTYNAAAGTTLQFTGGSAGNPLTVGTPPVLNGPGQYQFTSAYLLLTVDIIPNLELTGGTLELGPAFQGSSITNLTLDGTTLAPGTYPVSGTLIVTNSQLNGAITVNSGGVLDESSANLASTGSLMVAAGGTFNVTTGFSLFGPLTNAGTMNLTNANVALYNNNGAPYLGGIDNQGQMNFYGASGDHIFSQNGYEYLTNQGTINQEPGAGISSIGVYSGALMGTYNAATGTTLQFTGGSAGNPLTVGTPPVLNGPGQYQFTSAYLLLTVDIIPNLELTGGTLELGPAFQGGSITNLTLDGTTLAPGTYPVSGTLIVTNSQLNGAITVNSNAVVNELSATLTAAASLTIAAGGILNVTTEFSVFGPLTNAGTVNLTNANVALFNNGAAYLGGIDNQGQINFYGVSGDRIYSEEGFEYLTNQGAINVEPGAGISSISVYSGTMAGTYNAAAGATLQFMGGSAANPLPAGTPPVLNGSGQYQFTSGYLLLTVDVIPNLALLGGTLELGPSFQGGSITSLTLDGIVLAPGTYPVKGTLIVTNSQLNGALVVNSGGVLDDSSATLNSTGSLTVAAGGTLNVAGSLALYGPLTNAGTVNLTNASLFLYNNNGAPYLGGIDNQGQINFYGTSGDRISSEVGSEYIINQGTISQRPGAGDSTINANVFSDPGTLDSQEGTLTLNQLNLQSTSVLNFGLNSATDYGKIAVQTNAVLAGTMSANFNNGFVPANGDEFNVFSGHALSGTFANIILPAGSSGNGVYGSTVFSLLITTSSTPPSQPLLTIERVNATTVTVSWPTAAGNFNLQTSPVLPSANWLNISSGIATVGANYVYTDTVAGGAAFFRLQSQ
jgi:hypothetical protein